MKSFGERLGAVGALLGAFLAFLARSGALLGRLLGFMGASDLILGGFGEGLGGIWRGFGEGFAKVLEDFGKIYFDFLNWDPRAASLRPAERHNFANDTALRAERRSNHSLPVLPGQSQLRCSGVAYAAEGHRGNRLSQFFWLQNST